MKPRLPSFRSSLLRLHDTILRINEIAIYTSRDARLSELEKLVIVLEDRRFFSHQGYDLRSIAREIWKALTFRRNGGASTIDIQLFRTISNRYERTLRRKLREAVGARALQKKCSKIQILRVYLQEAYFGTGLTGSDAASQALFAKQSSQLTTEEASQIAALLVYPKPRVETSNWLAKISRRAEYGRFLLRTSQKDLNQITG